MPVTCLCPQCTSSPAHTYTPEYRMECEARMVCDMPTKERRAEYLALVERKRGPAGAEKLKAAVRKEWNERRAQ